MLSLHFLTYYRYLCSTVMYADYSTMAVVVVGQFVINFALLLPIKCQENMTIYGLHKLVIVCLTVYIIITIATCSL